MTDNKIEWPEEWDPKEGWPEAGTSRFWQRIDKELRKLGSSLEAVCTQLGKPKNGENDANGEESLVVRKLAAALREAQEGDRCVITDAYGNVLLKAFHEWAAIEEVEEPENPEAAYECMGCGLPGIRMSRRSEPQGLSRDARPHRRSLRVRP